MSMTGFSHRHFVDPSTGRTKRIYKYKGKPCQLVIHTSQKAKQLSGYVLIEKDLRNCLAWLDEIEARNDEGPTDQGIKNYQGKDRTNYTIIKGLFVALLTFYAKCFTRCEGRKIKLDKSRLDPEFHQIHEHLMSLRNNFAAHSGAELIEMARVVTIFSPIKKGKFKAQTIKELEQPDLLVTQPGDKSMRGLLLHTQAIVIAKIQSLSQSIELEEVPKIAMRMSSGS